MSKGELDRLETWCNLFKTQLIENCVNLSGKDQKAGLIGAIFAVSEVLGKIELIKGGRG